jgi:hypothetical protein
LFRPVWSKQAHTSTGNRPASSDGREMRQEMMKKMMRANNG